MVVCGSKRSWRRWLCVGIALVKFFSPIVSAYATEPDAARGTGKVEGCWIEFRDEMVRCGIEATVTAFLIRIGNPPPQPNETPPSDPPTDPPLDPPPPPPDPPDPPTGGGEDPPFDPPFDPPPPEETPEPASLITALVGVGLTSLYAWRRKRRPE